MYIYNCKGTCSKQIELEIENGIITHCKFIGGCAGNTKGVAALAVGRNADDVKELVRGIPCRPTTSCPDQLAHAIDEYEATQNA